ncbi:MAG: TonB family protein [Candidatus Sulfopaludibacter sp.]|nr:TonB family protein [Candidatus Sulfopaludibacter sp.]
MMPAINQIVLAVSGSLAASMVVKATLLVTLGLIGSAIAGRSRASVRHSLLAATFGVLLLLPVAAIVAPPVRLVVHVAEQKRAPPALPGAAFPSLAVTTPSVSVAPRQASRLSLPSLLPAAWLGGLALFLTPVILGLWRVRSLRRSALPSPNGQSLADRLARDAGIRRRVEVLQHEDLPGPMTCGVLHPAIVLPHESQTWDAGDLNRAIVHELEHVRRADWATQCLARMVCAAYWFHPLVWMTWRRLCLEAERSCDDAVLGDSEATAYADQLVGLAQRLSSAGESPLLAMANRSDLATRVGAVLDDRQPRGRAGTLTVALACAAAAMLVVTVSPFRMVAAPPTSAPVAESAPVSQPASEPAPQTPSPAPQTGPAINLRVRSNLVMVDVVVTDLAGNSIDGLGARDFVITEDGVGQNISTFEFHRVTMSPEPANAPKSYYLLGYYTSNQKQDGQFRRIQVIDKADTTAKLDYRGGYYASQQFAPPADAPAGAGGVLPPATLPPGSKPPILIFKKEPEYSEAARKAKYQGSVILYVEVDETGQPNNIKVLRSLGLGLDEKAIEAVKQWRFKPGTANGVPVTMPTQVKVDFSLL